MTAIDSNVPIDPKALVAAGVTDIGRYLHTLTRAEVDGYHAHGIRLWLIWELLAGAALGGAGQGAIDAQGALRAIAALGKPAPPPGVAVYFATDVDPGAPPAAAILDYYRATAVVRSAAYRNGSYAGAPAQLAGFGAGTIDFAWGPGATSWDHGLSVPGRVLQQLAVYDVVDGIPVDADVRAHAVLADDIGAWAPPAPVTPPPIDPPKEAVMLSTVPVAGPDGSPTAARYLVAVDPNGASLPQALPIRSGGDLQAWQALGAKPAGPGVALSQEALDAITPAKG